MQLSRILLKGAILVLTGLGSIGCVDADGLDEVSSTRQQLIAGLTIDAYQSFRVVTPGYTDRYLRHQDGLAFTEIVDEMSPELLKWDSSFRVVQGLANTACISLQSTNFPNSFLRHASFRLDLSLNDGSQLFSSDATFCPTAALDGGSGISLESENFPGHYLRHRNGEVWLDPFVDEGLYRADASWAMEEPFAEPPYEIVSAETEVSTGSFKQLSVECPGGSKVLGAGFGVLDATDAILEGTATYFEPGWNGSGWLTNARSLSGFQTPWKLKVTLVCANEVPAGYNIVATETAFESGSFKQLSVDCPTGQVATSSGFGVLDATSAILDGTVTYSLPHYNGSGWLMNARNNSGFSPSWKLRSRMVCVNDGAIPGYSVVSGETALDATVSKQLNLSCPSGETTLGGGYGVLDSTSAILSGVQLYSLPAYDGGSWLTNAKNESTNFAPDSKLRVSILCAD